MFSYVGGLLAIRSIVSLALLAKSNKGIYINSSKALYIGCMAGFLSGRPVIWHARDIINSNHFSPRHQFIIAYLAKKFTKLIIANSNATRRSLIQNKIPAKKITVIHNGISEKSFIPKKHIDSPFTIGIFSHLYPWKGHKYVIRALPNIPKARLHIVGEVLFGDKSYKAELIKLASQLGVIDRISFLGFRNDIPILMQKTDVIINASIHPEPFGRTIVEGMLCGKPVIATNIGGPKELIIHNQTGILIAPKNTRAIITSVKKLIKDVALRDRLGRAARDHAAQHFSLNKMYESIDRVISQTFSA